MCRTLAPGPRSIYRCRSCVYVFVFVAHLLVVRWADTTPFKRNPHHKQLGIPTTHDSQLLHRVGYTRFCTVDNHVHIYCDWMGLNSQHTPPAHLGSTLFIVMVHHNTHTCWDNTKQTRQQTTRRSNTHTNTHINISTNPAWNTKTRTNGKHIKQIT